MKKVVGTFKDGTLNGPCRVSFADEISMIGTFVNGDPKGLLRAFDAKGQLISKENFGVFNSPKNKLKIVNFCPSQLGQIIFLRFLGELKKPKSPFEIK